MACLGIALVPKAAITEKKKVHRNYKIRKLPKEQELEHICAELTMKNRISHQ
jgi:hypothetical protein